MDFVKNFIDFIVIKSQNKSFFFLSTEAIFVCTNIEEVDIESFIKKLKEKQKEAIKTTCKYIDLIEMENIYLDDYF